MNKRIYLWVLPYCLFFLSTTISVKGREKIIIDKCYSDSDSLSGQLVYNAKVKNVISDIDFGHRIGNRTVDSIDIIVVHSNYHVVDKKNGTYDFNPKGCISQFREHDVAPPYMITRDGTILKMVDERNVAWHSGNSALPDGSRQMINTNSIGIEIINKTQNGPTEAQYKALGWLLKDICSRYDIHYLTRHSDIAIPRGRKDDPWGIDWKRVVNNIKILYPSIVTYDVQVRK